MGVAALQTANSPSEIRNEFANFESFVHMSNDSKECAGNALASQLLHQLSLVLFIRQEVVLGCPMQYC